MALPGSSAVSVRGPWLAHRRTRAQRRSAARAGRSRSAPRRCPARRRAMAATGRRSDDRVGMGRDQARDRAGQRVVPEVVEARRQLRHHRPAASTSRSMKLATLLRMKYSSPILRPPATARLLSAMNSLLCMRRLMRANSCIDSRKRARCCRAHRQRVEQPHLEVRVRRRAWPGARPGRRHAGRRRAAARARRALRPVASRAGTAGRWRRRRSGTSADPARRAPAAPAPAVWPARRRRRQQLQTRQLVQTGRCRFGCQPRQRRVLRRAQAACVGGGRGLRRQAMQQRRPASANARPRGAAQPSDSGFLGGLTSSCSTACRLGQVPKHRRGGIRRMSHGCGGLPMGIRRVAVYPACIRAVSAGQCPSASATPGLDCPDWCS